MASEQFSLCWDNFHKNMSSGMNSLLENEDLVDVTLAVDGKCLKAHKMVLSVCSPYFRELFKSNPCQHPIVFMKDVSYIAMSDLLQFMYQGEVQVSQENLTTFIKTAEALQIKGLTGDGNGSGDCDNDQDESRAPEIELPKPTPPPPRPVKKIQHSPAPPIKRPRLSAPEASPSSSSSSSTTSAPHTVTKTEPPSAASVSSNENLIQFKMEPYDQSQSAVTITDDNPDESFDADPLDDPNAEDANEDYSMMEGGDDEPQAGTSADGAAGEGQGFLNTAVKIEDDIEEDFSSLITSIPSNSQQQMIVIGEPRCSGAKCQKVRKSITLATKLDILRRADSGERSVDIARALGLPPTTIGTIRRDGQRIRHAVDCSTPLYSKQITYWRNSLLSEVESMLKLWIQNQVAEKVPITSTTIRERAKELFEKVKKESKGAKNSGHVQEKVFDASRGWFQRFKIRANLQEILQRAEVDSGDVSE